MNAQHVFPLPNVAAPSPDQGAGSGLASIGVATGASFDLTITCLPGAEATAPETQFERLATLQAVLALINFELHPTATGIYIVMRWNWARRLATLDDVQDFAQQVGVQL